MNKKLLGLMVVLSLSQMASAAAAEAPALTFSDRFLTLGRTARTHLTSAAVVTTAALFTRVYCQYRSGKIEQEIKQRLNFCSGTHEQQAVINAEVKHQQDSFKQWARNAAVVAALSAVYGVGSYVRGIQEARNFTQNYLNPLLAIITNPQYTVNSTEPSLEEATSLRAALYGLPKIACAQIADHLGVSPVIDNKVERILTKLEQCDEDAEVMAERVGAAAQDESGQRLASQFQLLNMTLKQEIDDVMYAKVRSSFIHASEKAYSHATIQQYATWIKSLANESSAAAAEAKNSFEQQLDRFIARKAEQLMLVCDKELVQAFIGQMNIWKAEELSSGAAVAVPDEAAPQRQAPAAVAVPVPLA